MLLEFELDSTLFTASQSEEDEAVSRMARWDFEQIMDFVRKLGFLDKDKEGGDKINDFLVLNQVSPRIKAYYHALCSLSELSYYRLFISCLAYV